MFLLTNSARRRVPVEPAYFQCISMLATAVGLALTKHIQELLSLVFTCPLSDSLTQALVDLAHYIPPLLPQIQDRLLNMLSLVLSGRSFKPLGSPNEPTAIQQASREATRDSIGTEHKDAEIILALHTLGSFDFTGSASTWTVTYCFL